MFKIWGVGGLVVGREDCCDCHKKVRPGHMKCCKIMLENLKIWCATMQPSQEISALTSEHLWWTGLFYCAWHAKYDASLQIFLQCPTPAIVFETATKPSRFAHLWQGAKSLTSATQNDDCDVFSILTSKNVLRATTACTSWTSQLPKVAWACGAFSTLDFEMCFAPQPRALWTSQLTRVLRTRSALNMFTFKHVLRGTLGCNCSCLIWPDGSAPAASASPLFDPPEPQNIGKPQCFATFLPFRAPSSSFFWLFLFSDLLFFLSLLWLFPPLLSICPYCQKFYF